MGERAIFTSLFQRIKKHFFSPLAIYIFHTDKRSSDQRQPHISNYSWKSLKAEFPKKNLFPKDFLNH